MKINMRLVGYTLLIIALMFLGITLLVIDYAANDSSRNQELDYYKLNWDRCEEEKVYFAEQHNFSLKEWEYNKIMYDINLSIERQEEAKRK